LAINHYTTYFTCQSKKETMFLMETGVADIPDDSYAKGSSEWLQVSR
jgi:hypothetical protein